MKLKFIFILALSISQVIKYPSIDSISKQDIIIPVPITIKEIHDTVILFKENTIVKKEYILDSITLLNIASNSFSEKEKVYKTRISNLEFIIAKSKIQHNQSVVIRKKLDTTTREKNKAEREIAKTKEIIYDWPKYFLIVLIFIIISLLIYQFILNRKLRRKVIHRQHTHGNPV
jgi:hypothetical protein